MRLSILGLIIFLSSCGVASIHLSQTRDEVKVAPKLEAGPKHLLLLNAYDTRNRKFRDNKKELFDKFIDSVLNTSETIIETQAKVPVDVIRGFTDISKDGEIAALLAKHKATHAIILNQFNVDFDQTNVETTRSSSGSKSKEAFYDIVSSLEFSVYNKDSLIDAQSFTAREKHSSRSVVSGLLAAGPNVVAQRKDAWAITEKNLGSYLRLVLEMLED